jgi:hypothetical protein
MELLNHKNLTVFHHFRQMSFQLVNFLIRNGVGESVRPSFNVVSHSLALPSTHPFVLSALHRIWPCPLCLVLFDVIAIPLTKLYTETGEMFYLSLIMFPFLCIYCCRPQVSVFGVKGVFVTLLQRICLHRRRIRQTRNWLEASVYASSLIYVSILKMEACFSETRV